MRGDALSQYYNETNARAFQTALRLLAVAPVVDWPAWVGPKLTADAAKYAYSYFKVLHAWLEHVAQTPSMILCAEVACIE